MNSDRSPSPEGSSSIAGLRPSAVFTNDISTHLVTEVSFVFTFSDNDAFFHRESTSLKAEESVNYQSPTAGLCTGIFCIAWVTLKDGTHRLLSQRTPYVDGAGGIDVRAFRSSDMNEQP